MPRISAFYGIVIAMYHREHGVPHFHAIYSGARASIAIETLGVLEGSLPRRVQRMVEEWAELHRDELLANWQLTRDHQPPERIDPLP